MAEIGGELAFQLFVLVIPAKAGIQFPRFSLNLLLVPERHAALDSRLRGNDEGWCMFWWLTVSPPQTIDQSAGGIERDDHDNGARYCHIP